MYTSTLQVNFIRFHCLFYKHAMELCIFLANYSKTLLMQPLKDQGNKIILMRFPEEKITVFGCIKGCYRNNKVVV